MNRLRLNPTFSFLTIRGYWRLVWQALLSFFGRFYQRRVPVFRQLDAAGCGAACLAMVLSYFGRSTSVAECTQHLGANRDGLTAQVIAAAARQYGLRVKAYSLDLANFKHIQLPAIVHWNFNHFVVVEQWSAKQIAIVDPSSGRCQLTQKEFAASFTGVVLTFAPGVNFQRKSAIARSTWRSYLMRLLHTPGISGLLGQIFGVSLLLQLLGLAFPIFTQVLVDRVLPLHITQVMPTLGIGMVVLLLSQIVTAYLRATLLIYLQGKLDAQMMLGSFEQVLGLPFGFFQQRSSGDLLMRLSSNIAIREALTLQTLSVALDVPLVLVYLTILLLQAPWFGAIALGLGICQIALLFGTTGQVHNLMQRNLAAQATSQNYLVEALTGIATLKASGTEDRALDYWSGLFFKQLNISLQASHLSAIIDTAMNAVRTFAPIILLWIGALRVLDGSMSLGTMLALNAIATLFLAPLATLAINAQKLQLVGAHLERLTDIIETKPEQDFEQVKTAPKLTGCIELKNVSFRYAANSPWVLKDISLTIRPGQKVALVGRSGSGKSTLAKLLLGLYTPTTGEILYEGIPLQHLNYRSLRSQFGVVLQDSILFSSSIRQNIAFNDPNLSFEQVEAAAKLAAIDSEIQQMPMGYETLVAEGGTGLSGGQRQRLLLARALATTPAILLLDEATSHLDTIGERLVDENLDRLGCTRIAIAHRLSTIRNSKQIFVLEQGTIVEQGSHAELSTKNGIYAALLQNQLEMND